MYRIIQKVVLNPTVTKMVIEAPLIAQKAQPGQFIIIRPFEDSERIPLTIAGYDRQAGTVDIIFQIVGGTTMELNTLNEGDSVHDFVGPLGRATETEGLKKVCVVGGGVGCAIALPVARKLHEQGCVVHSVVGFRSKDLLITRDQAVELGEDEYFIGDLIGLKVMMENGKDLGVIRDVLETGANDVYIVDAPGNREILIPAIGECVKEVDLEAGVMTVHLLEGLLDL